MNELAITVGIILFPGLIAAVIADKISPHTKSWGTFKYSIYSFIFGVSCYVLLQGVLYGFWIPAHYLCPDRLTLSSVTLDVWSLVSTQTFSIRISDVFWATSLSPAVAAITAYIYNKKIINKLASKLGISSKYGDENLFSFYLNSPDIDWVYVRDIPNELTYQGRVLSYSEADDIQELVLRDVTVFDYATSDELYSLPKIYLSKPKGSFIIEAVPPNTLIEVQDGEETNTSQ
ncbi:hypothetical protein A9404_05175 [Halothiobacillus diazotrophicus]|uniref:Uncharacterized protein n=1 Tax=Halothiobacillus diazotrophicus TaxID=1860122 RepID=A0A191ZG67_9GAMM|nr:hypothetical protein [Halothiobacillus diazotrophicus]ANJ66847.1 hypothetical protein A9404_05175 [Halothiobacillus diazotrophicus]